MSAKKHIVTSALLYANGPIHIGHIAGAYLPADIYVRYLKVKKKDVVFISGSDEHGAAITLQAKKDGVTPQEIIDKYHNLNKKVFKDFGIDFSIYHRTSEGIHHKTAQEFFQKLEMKKEFNKQVSEQFYDEKNNQFLADRYISGECPKCNYKNAYGDQCEKCGSTLSPKELKNPQSTLSGETPILKETLHWYLQMQKHEKWLKEWIEKGIINDEKHHNTNDWKSQVIGQCKSWIDGGLQPRAITRDLEWGVKVPVKNTEGKVLYVWLDAPIGYISATKEWAKKNQKNWKEYWQNKDTELIHFIGKDNIVFHCILFPIILKSHGKYILPKNVPANAFLNLEGEKISTSRNWAIWLHEYLDDFKDQQDALRYTLCSISPEMKDSDFTWKDFQARNNNELVAIFGNFINRVVVLTNKYWDGFIPKYQDPRKEEEEIIEKIQGYPKKISNAIEKFRFREGLGELMNLARLGNKYLAENEPWKLIKTDEKQTGTIMYTAIQITVLLAVLSEPFLPFASKKLKKILNIDCMYWDNKYDEIINEGHKINKATHLFEKIDDDKIEEAINKLKNRQKI